MYLGAIGRSMINTKYKTGNKQEALEISPQILNMAKQLLTSIEVQDADRISVMLLNKSENDKAIQELREKVGYTPKRPISYANHELKFLPRWTRNAIRYLCDYIDRLTKHWAYACSENAKSERYSMGKALLQIRKDKNANKSGLLNILDEYNKFFYVPAKHDFNLPDGRQDHRFTSKEVVYTAFITMKLASMIIEITNCDPQLDCHFDRLMH